jgi:hypothetical protein
VPTFEAGADGAQVAVHDFASFGEVLRALPGFELRSRYKEFPSVEAWSAARVRAGRAPRKWRGVALELGVRWLGLQRWVPIRAVLRRIGSGARAGTEVEAEPLASSR